MDCAKLANTVLVGGGGMYILVLLGYHADRHSKDLFFPPKPKANSSDSRVWDIDKTNDGLGSNVRLAILFIHAILVVTLCQCWNDLGNSKHWKWYQRIQSSTKVHIIIFCNGTNTPQEDTVKVGEEALLCVYNGSAKDDPDSLRYERYSEKVRRFQTQ